VQLDSSNVAATSAQPALPWAAPAELERIKVQLGPAGGLQGVLYDCPGLTALHLSGCDIDVPSAAAAAFAATMTALLIKPF
jgi:hypothetical protein